MSNFDKILDLVNVEIDLKAAEEQLSDNASKIGDHAYMVIDKSLANTRLMVKCEAEHIAKNTDKYLLKGMVNNMKQCSIIRAVFLQALALDEGC